LKRQAPFIKQLRSRTYYDIH